MFDFLRKLWRYRDGMIYLSPAPLYHSAPQAAVNLAIRTAAPSSSWSTSIRSVLELIEKWGVTHSQLVPTMFSRMLKLPEDVAARATTCHRWRSRSTPPRPARRRSRKR